MKTESRICQNCEVSFTIESDDFSFYEKIKVPPPTFCWKCRMFRRLVWRNERALHKRKCDLCKKSIVAMYREGTDFPVYCVACWKGDGWDPLEYGQNYDFSKTFFEQFYELFKKVPRPAMAHNGTNINAEYANVVQDSKNVYLSYSVIWGCENVYYSNNVQNSKEILDSYNITESELIYGSIDVSKSYDCGFCYWSKNCVNSRFLLDCSDCQDCVACVNLRNKRYCIFNEQYSKEAYEEKLKELNLENYKDFKKLEQDFWEFTLRFPKRFARTLNSKNSSGDNLYNSNNANFFFLARSVENAKYGFRVLNVSDSMDVNHKGRGELVYEHCQGGSDPGSNLVAIIFGMPALNDSFYTDYCGSSSNLFGCVGVRNKSYCILNKRYEKEEYLELVENIKKHMIEMPYKSTVGHIYKYGEFFPPEFSPFGYLESVASESLPRSEDFVKSFGYYQGDLDHGEYEATMKASDLPDSIAEVADHILKESIECLDSSRAYKIIPEELKILKRMKLPLPRLHFDVRYKGRLEKLNPINLWHRQCMCEQDNHNNHKGKCTVEFETPYAPDRPETIYCEKCYQQEVY